MVYTLRERTEMIFIYGEVATFVRRAAFLFNERNQNRDVSHRYVIDLVSKFFEIGSVMNKEAKIEVLGTFPADPTSSLRSVAEQKGMSREIIRKPLKKHNFHPYKMQILQELHEDDYDEE